MLIHGLGRLRTNQIGRICRDGSAQQQILHTSNLSYLPILQVQTLSTVDGPRIPTFGISSPGTSTMPMSLMTALQEGQFLALSANSDFLMHVSATPFKLG